MNTKEVLWEKSENGFLVRSPLVGWLHDIPSPGSVLLPRSYVGKIQVMQTVYSLSLPAQVGGIVVAEEIPSRIFSVSYRQILFHLVATDNYQLNLSAEAEVSITKEQDQSGKYTVCAPTDGMFYRRPSPDADFYVEKGSKVEKGQVLGLIEVMKTFNEIFYEGPPGKIDKICAADGTEVKNQQPLFIIDILVPKP